jgi:hypothetical protein
MTTAPLLKRALAATVLSSATALAGLAFGSATANAQPYVYGPLTWCPGQATAGMPDKVINWDWNTCHTYYSVDFGVVGNVSEHVWEGAEPPPGLAPGSISIPPRNCGLFYCEYPGGRR